MELSDEITISANRDKVYASLNNPEILQLCIPGCKELIMNSPTEMVAKLVLKIGPVKANFSGTVTLDPSEAPDKIGMIGQGDGGVAGFAKGGADVVLIDRGDETLLKYTAKAEIGGKIAQLGSRLIVSTARKLSHTFFTAFEKVMRGENPGDS